MPDLILLHAGHTPRCTARVDKYFVGYYSLQMCTEGEVALSYGTREFSVRGAGVWGCWPGPHIQFHAAQSEPNVPPNSEAWWEHRYIAFTGERVQSWEEDGLWPLHPQDLSARASSTCRALFDELLQQFQASTRGEKSSRARCVHAIEGVLLEALREREAASSTWGAREAWLEGALEWLSEESNAWPDYQVLAEVCGMGLSTLRRKFKAATGRTLHEHTLSLRVERARKLLIETDWPLKAIASKLGYSDTFFFAAQFKSLAGVPPAAFRKSRM